MEVVNGTVTRLVHTSATGGVIFRIQPEGTSRTIRVVVPGKAIGTKLKAGECWEIFGDYKNDRKYGRQFFAVSAVQKLPVGRLIIGLFGHHSLFTEFGALVGRRIWRRLGNQAYDELNRANHGVVGQAGGIAPSAAVRLIQAWRSLCTQIEVSAYFAAHGLPVSIASQAIEFWGASTAQVIGSNPYLLAHFISWSEIDNTARSTFGVEETSSLRLIAACNTSADSYFSKRSDWSMALRDLQAGVKSKLGDNKLVAHAIDLSIATGAIFVSGESKKASVQSRGWHILTSALSNRLSELARYRPKCKQKLYRNDLPSQISLLEPSQDGFDDSTGSVTLVSFFWQDLPHLVEEPRLAGATHIFLSSSQRDAIGLPTDSRKSCLLQQFLSNESNRLIKTTCYVVHGTAEIDIVTACKLLHALPDRHEVFFLTSMHELEESDSRFIAAIRSTLNVALTKYVAAKGENANVLKELKSSQADFTVESSRHRTIPCPAVMPLEGKPELEAIILSTYRKTISMATAVILTDTQAAAKVFNFRLHEEQMEVRKFEHLPTQVIRLANGYTATVGDTVLCHQSNHRSGVVAGSVGNIINIAQPNVHTGDESDNTIIAQAFIDTIGEVSLTANDCLKFHLGYAIPITLDKWSSYDVRIVFLGSGKLPGLNFLKQLMYKTTSFLYIAGYDGNSISSLIINFYQSLEKE
jgi:hypothetical protein